MLGGPKGGRGGPPHYRKKRSADRAGRPIAENSKPAARAYLTTVAGRETSPTGEGA
jgi:hypothetical protein